MAKQVVDSKVRHMMVRFVWSTHYMPRKERMVQQAQQTQEFKLLCAQRGVKRVHGKADDVCLTFHSVILARISIDCVG